MIGFITEKLFFSLQYLVSYVTQLFVKPKSQYELSAMVYHVIWTSRKILQTASRDNFIALFERFEHPSILLEDEYTLYSISTTEAIFVHC